MNNILYEINLALSIIERCKYHHDFNYAADRLIRAREYITHHYDFDNALEMVRQSVRFICGFTLKNESKICRHVLTALYLLEKHQELRNNEQNKINKQTINMQAIQNQERAKYHIFCDDSDNFTDNESYKKVIIDSFKFDLTLYSKSSENNNEIVEKIERMFGVGFITCLIAKNKSIMFKTYRMGCIGGFGAVTERFEGMESIVTQLSKDLDKISITSRNVI